MDIENRRVRPIRYNVKSYDVNAYYILVRFFILIYFSFFNFEQTLGAHSIYHADVKMQYFRTSLEEKWNNTYLLFLLIEVVNNDTNEQVQGEKRPKNDKDDKIQIHVQVVFVLGLL